MLSQEIRQLAQEFQSSVPDLEENNTDAAILHDAIHAITGLGVSLEEEELVLNITNVLEGGYCSEHLQDRVENLITMISQFPVLFDIIEALTTI